jgi:hypothetical protein
MKRYSKVDRRRRSQVNTYIQLRREAQEERLQHKEKRNNREIFIQTNSQLESLRSRNWEGFRESEKGKEAD